LDILDTLLVNYYNERRSVSRTISAQKALPCRGGSLRSRAYWPALVFAMRRDEINHEYWGTFGDVWGHLVEWCAIKAGYIQLLEMATADLCAGLI
jgi:hypothetical protein